MQPEPTEFHDAPVRVRYAETDQMGVVYHANYLIWFEIGRVELMRALGFEYKTMESEDDCYIVVAEVSCRYLHPRVTMNYCACARAFPRRAIGSSNTPTNSSATPMIISWPPEPPPTSSAAAMANPSSFPKNIAINSAPWRPHPLADQTRNKRHREASRRIPDHPTRLLLLRITDNRERTTSLCYSFSPHERTTHRKRSNLRTALPHRRRTGRSFAFSRCGRAHERLPSRRGPPRRLRQNRLRHQHRLRQTRKRAHFQRTSPPAPGESRAFACLRRRRTAQ